MQSSISSKKSCMWRNMGGWCAYIHWTWVQPESRWTYPVVTPEAWIVSDRPCQVSRNIEWSVVQVRVWERTCTCMDTAYRWTRSFQTHLIAANIMWMSYEIICMIVASPNTTNDPTVTHIPNCVIIGITVFWLCRVLYLDIIWCGCKSVGNWQITPHSGFGHSIPQKYGTMLFCWTLVPHSGHCFNV